MRVRLAVALLVLATAPGIAAPGDRLVFGYLASRPIAGDERTGIAHTLDARWQRALSARLDLGAGLEVGFSGGDEPLARVALLPGAGWSMQVGALTARVDAAAGWQIVRGRVTLDALPLRGIETRGWHGELGAGLDGAITDVIDLRARSGIAIDGLYPAGHTSTRAAPFVELALVVHP